jgi:hypothetical protein
VSKTSPKRALILALTATTTLLCVCDLRGSLDRDQPPSVALSRTTRRARICGGITVLEHEKLKLGHCGIFGFGGIGAATGRLMHGIGMRVHAINRHGRTNERVDWIGTPERLNELLEVADVLVISAPLTRATRGLIGADELHRMKDDAILVNLARGEIVQERPLYDHLVKNPRPCSRWAAATWKRTSAETWSRR